MNAQCSYLDRISALPQPIIENILCRLSIEDVVRTSILSRDWRYNWIKIPQLAFTERQFNVSAMLKTSSVSYDKREMTRKCKFLYAMYQVLLLHQSPIDVFSLSMDSIDVFLLSKYKSETCAEIDQIILLLSRNHNTLKKFELCFKYTDPFSLGYRLPFSLFSLNQLTHLSLRGCHLDDKSNIKRFGRLTTLYLDNVSISVDTLLHFVSSCPLIKRFTLLLDDIEYIGDDHGDITKLFDCLYVVEHLCISHIATRCFAEDGVPQELPTTLGHLKFFCFVMINFTMKYGLPFVGLVIRSSPNLEKLRLTIYQDSFPFGESPDESEIQSVNLQDYSDIWLEHLKELEIEDFYNLKHELEFVKLILAKSPVLKKVSIFLNSWVTKDQEMMVLRILSCSPRASLHLKIFVERCPKMKKCLNIYMPADECRCL